MSRTTERDFFNELVDLLVTTGRTRDGQRHTRRAAKAIIANLQSLCLLPYEDGGETLNGRYSIANAWAATQRVGRAS
jgi:hypothetical protein